MFSTKLFRRFSQHFISPKSEWKKPVRVALTGASGNIGYATAFRIANGAMLGPDQPVILHLIDLPFMMDACKGVEMELNDCAFPLVHSIVRTDNFSVGFKDVDYCLLIGSKPRGPGMERADLLKDNGKIFVETGKAINDNAKRDAKCLVVGNPANTNCLILKNYCPDMNQNNFHAMTRLDHDRGVGYLATKTGKHVDDIKNFCIWGNHSSTMYPDITRTGIKLTKDENDEFVKTVQTRGAAIIKARKLSSAASAGNAALSHMRDWTYGTNGEMTSFSMPSDGSYGIEKGLIYSFPTTVDNKGKAHIVQGLDINSYSREMMDKTKDELISERDAVSHLMN